ncbi:MAG TPA: translation initiation factor IF-2 subunit alpha [Thermofilum sp.]|nr:translation initiation factor IF-2 subunit alpha [Thermofilum sp.]
MRRREEMPSYNELVIGTITEIHDHGAFVTLDEYGGLKAYIPLNEVSHSWFRGIREVLKVGQKRVFKVIRVDRRKKLIDVSLKRVSDGERRSKILSWKRAQRAEKLLEIAADRLGKSLEEAYREAGWKIEDHYGDIFTGLEEAALNGKEALLKAGVPGSWAEILAEVAKSYIKISKARISGIFTVKCLQRDGIDRLKRVLTSWEGKVNDPNIKVRMYTLGSPRYKVDIEALDYKTAEKTLKTIVDSVISTAKEEECQANFERLKG